MRTNPVGQRLAISGLGEGVTGSPQNGDENLRLAGAAGMRVTERHRRPGVIDEEFLARQMSLAHGELEALPPFLIEKAKLGVRIRVQVRGAILFPKELPGDTLTLEFLMDEGEIQQWPGRVRRGAVFGRWRVGEREPGAQGLFAELLAFRPTQLRLTGGGLILANNPVAETK